MLRDVRHALRALVRAPRFSAAAVLILGIGIGANCAIFSLIDAVLLRPLTGVGAPDALVSLRGDSLSYPQYRTLRDGARGTVQLAAAQIRTMSLVGNDGGDPEVIGGALASGNYFDVLAARPALGRFFGPSEEDGFHPVAVLSHRLWRSRFGESAAVLGRTVRLNGVPFEVIGVAPRGFRGVEFGDYPDLWVTIGAMPRLATGGLARLDIQSRNWGWLRAFGRLAPGVTRSGAASALVTILQGEAAAHGETFDPSLWSLSLTRAGAAGLGGKESTGGLFVILSAAVAAALLIACANLANLLLARAAAREREVAIRRALGASRARLVGQMLAESLLLALAGGACGLLGASWAISALSGLGLPGGLTLGIFEPEIGGRVAGFAMLVSGLTGVAFGLLPALHASRAPIESVLRSTASTLARRSVARGVFLGAQVALCLALLATAGLFTRSLSRALAIDLGFRPAGMTLAKVRLGLQRYDPPRAAAFLDDLTRRLSAQSGVRAVSWTGILPLSGEESVETFEAEGYAPAAGEKPVAQVAVVGAGYFRALQVPLAAGREFEASDRGDAPPVAVVNEAMARRYWPGRSPIGRLLTVDKPRRVVGVVRDARFASLSAAAEPYAFAPVLQFPTAALDELTLVVRADATPAVAAGWIRAAVRELDPSLPVTAVGPYADVIAGLLLPQRAGAALLGVFGALALLLAAFGIYAVVSYSVAQRTREVGIRIALGAAPAEVRGLVVRQSAAPIAAGLAAGLLLAAAAARLLGGLLYGVAPLDPIAFGAATLALAASGLLAAWVPARRASRIDPIAAIRTE
ncbi:MAG TPA: ADOP family duplicated permease [Thermoanaerobaculia bacterium]|jgi:predicted permease